MTATETEYRGAIKLAVDCTLSVSAFIKECVKILDPVSKDWISFDLWPEQEQTLETIDGNKLVIILKARQIGMTWLTLAYALWKMLLWPVATVLIFSRRETEAIHLVEDRLKGIYKRLPDWIKGGLSVVKDSAHIFELSNGSSIRAFPTSAGDSYAATLAIVDEADLAPDLEKLINAAKPTIDAGGQMILLSRVDKSKPQSLFKKIYLGAKQKLNNWTAIFLPWFVHPDRDQKWYDAECADAMTNTGALDSIYEQYPATDAEALSPKTLNKRIPPNALLNCYEESAGIKVSGAPTIPTGIYFKAARPGRRYVITGDPAEGLPSSDDSAMDVMDRRTGEQVFHASGKFTPETFAGYIDIIGTYYNNAPALVERNNHGHAVLLWLKEYSKLSVFNGRDGRPGWQTNSLSKSLMYNDVVEAIVAQEILIHCEKTKDQLSSIEAATLSAPKGMLDDAAISISLCIPASAMKWPDAKRSWSAKSVEG